MSISKTLLFLISALLPSLLVFLSCAPRSASTCPQPDQAEQAIPAEQTIAAEPQETKPTNLEQPPAAEADSSTDELTAAEPEETEAQEVEGLKDSGNWEEGTEEPSDQAGIEYDFPVVVNKQVEFYLDFFQNKQHRTFAHWLARSGRYLPLIQKELEKADLPLDLAYLPMIESGYSLTAYSRARAVGLWQFIRGTARNYGLRIDSYVDERRDPIKSTRAAVRYLAQLHEEFGSWQLAVAGYNAGEGKIRWAVRQAGTDNFWLLSRYLNLETKRYVPKLIAAIIIAKEPAKYGFPEIDYDKPLDFEIAKVPRWTPLQAVAAACDTDAEQLHDLNRELRQAVTPPGLARYPLKVPPNKAKLVARNLPRVEPVVTTRYKTHVVRSKRETLTQICRIYHLNKLTLLKANNLRSVRLGPGQRLRIPCRETSYKLLAPGMLASYQPAAATREDMILHTIRPGETVSDIAKKYNVPVRFIVAWNHLGNINRIRAGQKLALYLAVEKKAADQKGPAVIEPKTFKLAAVAAPRGDLSSSAVKKAVAPKNLPPATRLTYYRVQGGDTLWDIARKFNLSTDEIKRWNQLDDDTIHPGLQLLLRVTADDDADV